MRPTWTIEDIYATPGRARVLRALALSARPFSVRALARSAGVSHTACGAVLRDLSGMGLVVRHDIGTAHAYSLERTNAYVQHMVLTAIEAETRIVEELKRDLVRDYAEHCVSLILFGSYAYGDQREDSDIDVFALVADARREQLLRDIHLKRWMEYSSKYSAPLSLMVFTLDRASESLGWDQSAFRTELASTGIILHGLGVDEWGLDCDGDANKAESTPPGSPRR